MHTEFKKFSALYYYRASDFIKGVTKTIQKNNAKLRFISYTHFTLVEVRIVLAKMSKN